MTNTNYEYFDRYEQLLDAIFDGMMDELYDEDAEENWIEEEWKLFFFYQIVKHFRRRKYERKS